ncbi:ABC transporter ATP-binding protein [Streptomyces sp. NPDC097640]|uniref:ABC transporter ATP-binding protein n=1 Tax=Streptomyces sp. NPDC097640 TaxID=3157229 RepID=UPI003326C327
MTQAWDEPIGPPPTVRETWQELSSHIRQHRALIALGGLLALVGSAMALAQPLAAKAMVDALAGGESITGVLIVLTALIVLGTVVQAVGQFVLERAAESIVLSARRKLVFRLLRLRLPELNRKEPGDLMSRVIADTTMLRQVTTETLVSAVVGGLTLLATMVLMGVLDPILFGISLAVVTLIGGSVCVAMPRVAVATREVQESVGSMSSVLERAFGAFRTIKAAGAEQRETAAIDAAAHHAWRQGVRVAKLGSVAYSITGLAVQLAFLTVLGVGGARVASGAIPVSSLIAFLLLLFQLTSPLSRLVEAVSQYQAGSAAMARISEAQNLITEQDAEGGGSAPPSSRPSVIEFRNVTFRYRPELPDVLQSVTLRVQGPGLTAIVGPSGAGKTTLFGLIERFYEADRGRVLIDGTNVLDWPLGPLRASIGYVEQDAPVVSGTLRENLTLAATNASDEDIREVLIRTRLDALVDRLPDGLDTPVGHRGSALSGGERQRVAIARALLRRPRLLLLDEATSQLDAMNERVLRDVVQAAARDSMVLVIAHRLSTVIAARRIIVMDAGRVRAIGTHRELVTGDRLYAELASTQFLAEGTAGSTEHADP